MHVKKGAMHNILTGNPEEKKPLRSPRSRWEDNIITDI
jgi:hypothetical protein